MTIRSLLEHVGIPTKGKKIFVNDREVDPEMVVEGLASGEKDLTDRYSTITNRFTYHSPTEQQIVTYATIRRQAKELAFLIEEFCPDSDEKTTALTRLDEVVMHANAAIARHS